jgi:hypothetical protein
MHGGQVFLIEYRNPDVIVLHIHANRYFGTRGSATGRRCRVSLPCQGSSGRLLVPGIVGLSRTGSP